MALYGQLRESEGHGEEVKIGIGTQQITFRLILPEGGSATDLDAERKGGCGEKLLEWVEMMKAIENEHSITVANTVMGYRTGILNWYDHHVSNAKVEGINNIIKVLKRVAYGYRDEEYFKLRLFALHDARITRNVG